MEFFCTKLAGFGFRHGTLPKVQAPLYVFSKESFNSFSLISEQPESVNPIR